MGTDQETFSTFHRRFHSRLSPGRGVPSAGKLSGLVLRSSKDVHKAAAVGAVFGLGPSPDPGPGAGVELGGGCLGGAGDLVGSAKVWPARAVLRKMRHQPS